MATNITISTITSLCSFTRSFNKLYLHPSLHVIIWRVAVTLTLHVPTGSEAQSAHDSSELMARSGPGSHWIFDRINPGRVTATALATE